MTDYQKLLIDNIANDLVSICDIVDQDIYDDVQASLESRIEAYDNERREQYIKALSESLPRLVSEVI